MDRAQRGLPKDLLDDCGSLLSYTMLQKSWTLEQTVDHFVALHDDAVEEFDRLEAQLSAEGLLDANPQGNVGDPGGGQQDGASLGANLNQPAGASLGSGGLVDAFGITLTDAELNATEPYAESDSDSEAGKCRRWRRHEATRSSKSDRFVKQ